MRRILNKTVSSPSFDDDRLCEHVAVHTPTGSPRMFYSSEENGMKHDEEVS